MKKAHFKAPKTYRLAEKFLRELKDGETPLHSVYFHLFCFLSLEDLERNLEYTKSVRLGKDEYFKKEGKNYWFTGFHKSIRQIDFFHNIYKKSEPSELSTKELSEYNYLYFRVIKEGYVKEAPKGSGQLFTDEYKRYLELSTKKRERKIEKNVGGHLDSILWHTIHCDKANVLFNILKRI